MKLRQAGFAAALTLAFYTPSHASAQQSLEIHVGAIDYPAGVSAGRTSLFTHLRINVGADGSVTGCRIVRSSRQPVLDREACRIFRRRARLRQHYRGRTLPVIVTWTRVVDDPVVRSRGEPLMLTDALPVTHNDYPNEAIARREEGDTRFEVDVSEEGLPLNCRIASSSGSNALDERVCKLMLERAQFVPSIDEQGVRLRSVYRGRVVWRIP